MKIMFLNQAPRTEAYENERIENLLNGYARDETDIQLRFPEDFPGSKVKDILGDQDMLNGLHHAMEISPSIRKIVWAEENGYDAVIQSCTFDPGVEEARLAAHIPVIGLFRTALQVAANLSYRIGVLVPLPSHIPYTRRIVQRYQMSDFVSTIRTYDTYGKDVDRGEVFNNTVEQIKSIIDENGVGYVLPLGGALIPYVVSPTDLEEATGVPVMNTKAVGIHFTEMCVKLGMSQSHLTYPKGNLSHEDLYAKVTG